MTLQQSNTLVLDEPTNHLDLDSKEILENALDDFPGTLLFVSHDRYFINRIATKVIDVSSEGAVEYLGDYDYFVEKKLEQQELDAENGTPQTTTHPSSKRTNEDDKELRRQERRLTRAIDELETRMSVLDEEMAALQAELSMPKFADDHVKLMELQAQIDERQEEHDCKSEEWLLLQEQLEAL